MKSTVLKILSVILAASLTFAVIQLTVLGKQGVTESDYTFSLDSSDNATITGCSADLSGAVMLPESISGYTVVGIGDRAFKDCSDVTCFFLPSTVTNIGNYAFEGCTALLNASFPDTLTRIGEGAYWGCSSLLSVTLPTAVARIESCAFYGCSTLESLIVLGASTPVAGIFDVQLDIGEVVSLGGGVLRTGDETQTTVYCYKTSVAYTDLLKCQFSNYVLLDDCTLTSYSVSYTDGSGTSLYNAKSLSVQPIGIDIIEVAAYIDGYEPSAVTATRTLSGTAADNNITFTYSESEVSTTEEPTTEPTTEPPTDPPATLSIVAEQGSTAVIDSDRKYVYGLSSSVTEADMASYLGVTGNGSLQYIYTGSIGTGTIINLLDSSNNIVDTYTVIIFGDINGDGNITLTDSSLLNAVICGSTSIEAGSPQLFAADLNGDGSLLSYDASLLKACVFAVQTINQATGRVS